MKNPKKKTTTARAGKNARARLVRALLQNAFDNLPEEDSQRRLSPRSGFDGMKIQAAAEMAGLSRPSVAAAHESLRPVLVETGGARAAQTLALEPSHGVAFGVEFGHRHIAVGIVDLYGQLIEDVWYTAKDVDEDPRATLDRAAGRINELLRARQLDEADVVGVGMSLAHPIDMHKEGAVRALSMVDDHPWQSWQGLGDIRQQLRQRLGWSGPKLGMFIVDNDANLSAVAEQHWGAGRDRRHFLYVRWSDGIGAGLVLDGEVYRGAGGLAGALGHTPIVDLPNPEKCPRCGLLGCLETVASRRYVLASAGFDDAPDAIESLIDRAAERKDSPAYRALDGAAFHLGRAIGMYLHAVNPEAVVIGGSVGAKAFDLIRHDGLERGLWRQVVPSALEDVNLGGIHRGRFIRQTALRGAVARVLWSFLPEFLDARAQGNAAPVEGAS